jgi:hypothetical protein
MYNQKSYQQKFTNVGDLNSQNLNLQTFGHSYGQQNNQSLSHNNRKVLSPIDIENAYQQTMRELGIRYDPRYRYILYTDNSGNEKFVAAPSSSVFAVEKLNEVERRMKQILDQQGFQVSEKSGQFNIKPNPQVNTQPQVSSIVRREFPSPIDLENAHRQAIQELGVNNDPRYKLHTDAFGQKHFIPVPGTPPDVTRKLNDVYRRMREILTQQGFQVINPN